jgi:CelD/BcsL family acetyltransferase involved in cellulose biosynthesis
VRDIAGFAGLRDQWQPLLDRSKPNHVFMTWEWFFTWWKHFGHGRELFVIVVENQGETIGILPLMLFVEHGRRACKFRYLHFIGFRFEFRWNDWMDVIGVRKEEVIRAAMEYLQGCQHLWDYLDLWDIPEDSDTLIILPRLADRLGFPYRTELCASCPYLPTTSDWELYYGSHPPKKVTKDLERQIKRLTAGGDLKVEHLAATNPVVSLNSLFDLHQRREIVTDRLPMFSRERFRSFYRDLAEAFPREWLDYSVLKLNGTPIAAHFGFRYNNKLYFLTPAFDPDYRTYSPGKILLRYLIQHCFVNDGIHEFDFLRGDEPYKYQWATGERRGYQIQISNAYMSGWTGKVFRRIPPRFRRSFMEGFGQSSA